MFLFYGKKKVFYLQWPLSFSQSKPSLRHSGSIHSLSHDPSPNFSLHFLVTGHRPHGSPDAAVQTKTSRGKKKEQKYADIIIY